MGLSVSCLKPEPVESSGIPTQRVDRLDTSRQHLSFSPGTRETHQSADAITESDEDMGIPEFLGGKKGVKDSALTEQTTRLLNDDGIEEQEEGSKVKKFKSARNVLRKISLVLASRKVRLLRRYSPTSSVSEEDALFADIIREAEMRFSLARSEMNKEESKGTAFENTVTKSHNSPRAVESAGRSSRNAPSLLTEQTRTSEINVDQNVSSGIRLNFPTPMPQEGRLLTVQEGVKMFDD